MKQRTYEYEAGAIDEAHYLILVRRHELRHYGNENFAATKFFKIVTHETYQ